MLSFLRVKTRIVSLFRGASVPCDVPLGLRISWCRYSTANDAGLRIFFGASTGVGERGEISSPQLSIGSREGCQWALFGLELSLD